MSLRNTDTRNASCFPSELLIQATLPYSRDGPSLSDSCRLENVCQPDPAKQFRPSAIGDCVDDRSPIIVWTEVNPQRTLSERRVHDIHYCARHLMRGRIPGRKLRK